jgi:hypothetical protein
VNEETWTPTELSREIGVDQKRIRVFLRQKFGKLNKSVEPRWHLDAVRADIVRKHFAGRA